MKTRRKAKRITSRAIKQDIIGGKIHKDEEIMLSKFAEVIVKIIKRKVKF